LKDNSVKKIYADDVKIKMLLQNEKRSEGEKKIKKTVL